MRLAAILLSLALPILLATPAAAGGPPGTVAPILEAPAPVTRVERYGLHVALADAAWFTAALLLSGDDGGDGDGAATLVALGYYAGGPGVHLAHGNQRGALKSLGARALLPAGGALVGMALASGSDEDPYGTDVIAGLVLGGAVGTLTAMIVDWTVFAKKEETVAPRYELAGGLRPGVKLSRHGAVVSIGGAF